MPLFSIIIPTFNRSTCLSVAIESVLHQSFKDYELIVVDDGSTDDTEKIVSSYSDSRLRYLKQTNSGVCQARNHGVAKANGLYLVFLDSDDKFSIDYLNFVYEKTQASPDIIFVGVEFFLDSKLIRGVLPTHPYGRPSLDGLFLAGTFVVTRDLFLRVGGYDTLISYGENTELAIRLGPLLKKKIFIEESLLKVYQEKETRTSNSLQNVITSTEYILKKHTDYYKTNPNPKWLYHNVLAVGYIKSNNIEKARAHLVKAMKTYPWRFRSYLRYSVISIPFLRRKIYGA